jgi:pre-mRNA-splicing factor 18
VQYIQPFFEQLKNRTIPGEILDSIYQIANYSLMREYVKANDKYLHLAIGNAPWPMGVTMVGIHERSGRSKIFSSQIARKLYKNLFYQIINFLFYYRYIK